MNKEISKGLIKRWIGEAYNFGDMMEINPDLSSQGLHKLNKRIEKYFSEPTKIRFKISRRYVSFNKRRSLHSKEVQK